MIFLFLEIWTLQQKREVDDSPFLKYVICPFYDWASLQRGVSNPVTNSFKAKLYSGKRKGQRRWNKKPELLLFPWG